MEKLIKEWTGESVVISYDQPTATWIFIAIHSTTLGPALGGCRMRVYNSPDDGLRDAMRLAEGMTYKWATLGFELGGGKSVLAIPGPLDPPNRTGLLRRFGQILESLRGTYATGEDLGTTPEDMAVLGTVTRWVKGRQANGERAIDPGPYTALGVFTGIQTAAKHAFGSDDLSGRTVLVQGLGDVGEPLARRLQEAGAEILVCDLDEALARRVASELEGEAVEPHLAYARRCDVFAPCAGGAVLNDETIPQLQCRIVAGSANNQLATSEDGERLHDRGILYAPDYVVNAGGAIALPWLDAGNHTEQEIRDRIVGIGTTLDGIFREAEANNETPILAAQRMVDRVIEKKKKDRAAAVG